MMRPQDAGRGTDSVLAHMSLGELVIPRAFLDDENLRAMLEDYFAKNGTDMNQYVVGHESNSINPETGYPEFGFGKFLKRVFKIAAPLALSLLAPGIGTALGGSLLGAGAAGSATLGNALIGAGTGALSGGGLKGALLGGAAGGIGANLGSLGGGVAQGASLPGASAPVGYGSGILGSIGDATGLTSGSFSGIGDAIGGFIGSPSSAPLQAGAQGASTSGSGILGNLGAVGRGVSSVADSIGGLSGTEGGGSTFSGANLLSTALGGYADDEALKKAQERLLAGNQAQLENINSYEAGDYINNPEYQFKQAEGEKAINRSLGAQGGLFSGRALQAAADYNKGLNTDFQQRDYQQYLNRIGAQNPLIGNSADTRAATGIQRANVFGNTLKRLRG